MASPRHRYFLLLLAMTLFGVVASSNSGFVNAAGPSASMLEYRAAVKLVSDASAIRMIPNRTTPLLSELGKKQYRFILTPKIKWTCIPAKTATTFEICKFGKIGSPFKMVLLGDSQASAWAAGYIKYAELNNVELTLLSMNSCPPWHMTITDQNGQPFPSCSRFQQFAQRTIMRIRPTAVVVTGVIPLTTGGVRPTQPQLEEGIRKLVSDLRPSGAKVALMSNNPMWYSNSAAGPPNCYFTDRSNIQKCAVKINSVHSSSSSNGILRTAILNSVSAEKVPFIDVEPLLCSQMCPVVVGSHLVYFDAFHIFWPYAEKLAMPLGHLLHNAVKAPTY